MKKYKVILLLLLIVILVGGGWMVWNKTASPTKIALLNFQKFQTTSLIQSNKDKFIKYEEVSLDNLKDIKNYDMVMVFGMGLKLTQEQRKELKTYMDKGTKVFVYSATSPENNITNLDTIKSKAIEDYMGSGNKKNYQSLARYIRKNIDTKKFFVTPPDKLVKSADDVYFHLDENVSFTKLSEYETYLKKHNFYKENAPKVALVGGLNDPYSGNRDNIDSIIVSFQNKGFNVYPISSSMERLRFLKEVKPDAVIYFAHGRLAMGQGDEAVQWLKESNIPVFIPLTILQTQKEWEKDLMGMMGGFFSQSVVVPELDGGIYPYALISQELDKDNLYVFKTIPNRLKKFTQIVSNFVGLKHKSNADKKVAIYYFKGPGNSTLTAQGLETIPSLYNLLKRMKTQGYTINNLPSTEAEFAQILMKQGSVMSTYAKGAFDDFLRNGNPELINKSTYESWIKKSMSPQKYQEVTKVYGQAPGEYMSIEKNGVPYLAVSRINFGNIVILPQPMAGLGGDSFSIIHGAKSPPPHTYIGSYLWTQYGFKADAIVHFGTHGSLEFTPQKQVALSDNDWPDILVGTVPHFYYYTIGNVGESMMAKRRTYASVVSYLTPSFMESNMRGEFKTLQEKINQFYKLPKEKQNAASLEIKKIAVQMGISRELRLDLSLTKPYTEEEVQRIDNYAEEIANEKINGDLYTSGIPYTTEKIHSTVMAMSADPIAYSLAALDKQRKKVSEQQLKNKAFFTQRYLLPAKAIVNQILGGKNYSHSEICALAGINPQELEEAQNIINPKKMSMAAMMKAHGSEKEKPSGKSPHQAMAPHSMKSAHGNPQAANPHSGAMSMKRGKPQKMVYTPEQRAKARAIVAIEQTISNVNLYKQSLLQSPENEFKSLLNALSGGYISPSSGGDAVANPKAVPTGRNLYSINAEATPSEEAWEKGKELAEITLANYYKQHKKYPQKVSYTFWSSEFIESEGTTIAQVLYMLGVQPVRDSFGRVSDLELIPSQTLGRPRVDVVIQTSGQFRDLAASRLELISRAVEMAANTKDSKFDNFVAKGTLNMEKNLIDGGVPPKDARALSNQRIFGGINGMYGTGIQEMVTSGDKWSNEKEIADTYLNNMGALYGNSKNWGNFQKGLFRAALQNTDVVIQPRQNNTWGALSLDHVYEFMGGLNLAVRDVTGKDPDAYFADYRNHQNFRMQEIKEAIGVEARSTIFNPTYIKERMKGGAGSAEEFTEIVTNTYGWNVMKPNAIDNEMWNQIYDTYVKDKDNLGTKEFFNKQNPAALQEITAVMLETSRKGLWKATEEQLKETSQLHVDLVKKFGSTGGGFSGENAKLQKYIASKVSSQDASVYNSKLQEMRLGAASKGSDKSMVLKKEEVANGEKSSKTTFNGLIVVAIIALVVLALVFFIRKRRKNNN